MSIAFYLTRSVRTIEHYLIYIECIESIKNTYPNAPIIVIRDNETLDFIEEEKAKNKVFIIQPKLPVKISRIEKDKDKLKALYNQGYEDAKEIYEDLMKFLEE